MNFHRRRITTFSEQELRPHGTLPEDNYCSQITANVRKLILKLIIHSRFDREDPGNAKGGKWIVRLPKGLASRYWEEIILALIGGQFPGVSSTEICGAVLSLRYSEDILAVWNHTAAEKEPVEKIRDAMRKILQLPAHANMEYKPHQASIQDKSSFRNTNVWKPKSAESRSNRSGSWGERDSRPKRNNNRESERAWR